MSYQNIPAPGMQQDIPNSLNNAGYFQQNNVVMNWNQQSTMPNTASLSNSKFYLYTKFN